MGRIVQIGPADTQWLVESDDGRGSTGPLPPQDAEARALYDRLRAAGVQPVPYVVPPVDLAAYASAAHTARRDGGVTVGGMLIKTDSESRSLINGAYSLSEVRPDAKIDFKAASGWVSLDAATVQTVAVAVGTWVQACYSAYRAVSDGLASGSVTTTAQIDAAFAAVTLPG